MLLLRAAALVALTIFLNAQSALAQDVTLTSRDGSVKISGGLIGFDGEFYRVDTEYGLLTVDGSGVLCTGPACPNLEAFVARIRISGAAGLGGNLMPALVEAFATKQQYRLRRRVISDREFAYDMFDADRDLAVAEFSFLISNSDEGFADLISEESDMSLATREVDVQEIERAKNAGIGNLTALNQSRVIALDALVPVVSTQNTVQAISPTDLYRVFAGSIDNWSQLGGVDAPIYLHLGAQNSGVARVFQSHFGQNENVLASNITRHDATDDLVDAVARDPFAIGITTLSATGNAKRLTLSGSCGFRSVATSQSLRTEDYPLTSPLFVYLPSRRLPTIGREFLRFLRSPTAQAAVQRAGFTSQAMSEIQLEQQGNRISNAILAAGSEVSLDDLKRMVTALDGARRLSVGFRFQGGSSDLDAQSRSNIILVARALESGRFDNQEVIFAGFSDGDGPADGNMQLSRQRAESVKAAILREATAVNPSMLNISVEAFGEALPMACDDTEWGRRVNRRVEVWVR